VTEEIPIKECDCPCGSGWPFEECCGSDIGPDELEEAVVFALKRHPVTQHLSELEMWRFAESVTANAWPQPHPTLREEPQLDGAFYADLIERLIG
jgi:hypothetical protein